MNVPVERIHGLEKAALLVIRAQKLRNRWRSWVHRKLLAHPRLIPVEDREGDTLEQILAGSIQFSGEGHIRVELILCPEPCLTEKLRQLRFAVVAHMPIILQRAKVSEEID